MSPLPNQTTNQFVQAAAKQAGADHLPLSMDGVGESVIIQSPQGLDLPANDRQDFQLPARVSVEDQIRQNAILPDTASVFGDQQAIQHAAAPEATMSIADQKPLPERRPLQIEPAKANIIPSVENTATSEQDDSSRFSGPQTSEPAAVEQSVQQSGVLPDNTSDNQMEPNGPSISTNPPSAKSSKVADLNFGLANPFDAGDGADLFAAKQALRKESQQ